MQNFKNGAIILIGPTASGKTTLSIELAQALNGEILSADSRQVYRRMNIGTAKPSADELALVRHYGIDIKHIDEFFSAGAFARYGRDIIKKLLHRKIQPIVTGGSGLYIRALTDGFFGDSYRDEMLREHIKAEHRRRGHLAMRRWLMELDPDAEAKILGNDDKKILRALEVCLLSGKPISVLQKEHTDPADFPTIFFGLRWPRKELYERINRRVDTMMQDGLMFEVETLRHDGYGLEHNAMDSVGYKELIAVLDGTMSLDDAVKLIKQNTRRYAKRQMTWFRRDQRIKWLDCDSGTSVKDLVQIILNTL